MGTFTKSFGSCGGYIAGDAGLIAYLRNHCPAHLYAAAMAPPVGAGRARTAGNRGTKSSPRPRCVVCLSGGVGGLAACPPAARAPTVRSHACPPCLPPVQAVEMVISALHVIQGRDGTGRGRAKIKQLRDNSNYFRRCVRARARAAHAASWHKTCERSTGGCAGHAHCGQGAPEPTQHAECASGTGSKQGWLHGPTAEKANRLSLGTPGGTLVLTLTSPPAARVLADLQAAAGDGLRCAGGLGLARHGAPPPAGACRTRRACPPIDRAAQ